MNARHTTLVVAALAWIAAWPAVQAQRADGARAGAAPALRVDGDRLMEAVRTLASPRFEGRRAGTPGNTAAREWIRDRFTSIGLVPVTQTFEKGANVSAVCQGARPGAPAIVVSAHFDHLGVRDGRVFPGADDNASGVAVLLAVAEQCARAPFRHTIILAAFDAEEQGLLGSAAFLRRPPVPRASIGLNVNLDMLGRSDRRELFAAGTYHWPGLKPSLEEVAGRSPIALVFGHDRPAQPGGPDDWTMESDHGTFHESGIPFVYFGVEDHADYHRPTDTADKIDRAFLVGAAETVLDAVRALDRLDAFK
jgi:Zn-dependent M28 family amino/carboxypeptidase